MKVKTDWIPKEGLEYLTPGKIYDAIPKGHTIAAIKDDLGWDRMIVFENSNGLCCAHLNNKMAWEIIEE